MTNFPVLLVSLGTSSAIVPEAFLLPGIEFRAVFVITTETTEVGFVQQWFADHAPQTVLSVTRVHGFRDFTREEDHFRFEEVLYRWILGTETHPEDRFLCLSGGFKTMSAAMQKAAAVLGAAEVFHVLCDLPGNQQPKNAGEIEVASAGGHLHWIRLGPESGWPQVRATSGTAYPLKVIEAEGCVRQVLAADHAFRDRLHSIVERSHRIAGAWDRLSELPFAELATWSEGDLTWLNQPVDPDMDAVWIAALPKLELHCHLGGFATHGESLRGVRSSSSQPERLPSLAPPAPPEGWPLPAKPVTLKQYMQLGDANGSALLTDPGCLRGQCEQLYRHFLEQHVLHVEIRCSPANYAREGRSPWTVLSEIKQTFDNCMKAARQNGGRICHVNLIVIATRKERGDYRAAISRHLALAVSAAEHWTEPDSCRVVGVDLAGFENRETRAHYFREEFTGIHRCGLALTVHAGENDDAEGIWRAVFDLNARRLGHALHLVDSPELMRSVADRGVGVEMCPYANVQIRGFHPITGSAHYPLLEYLRRGVRVTVNTDNIGISGASLSDNLCLAARLCPQMTRLDLLWLQRHALDAAFVSVPERRALLRRFTSALPKP